MASRDDLLRDLDAIERHSERHECGDGCRSGADYPLAKEGSRLRDEMERLWAIEDQAADFVIHGGLGYGLKRALGLAD